MSGITSIFPRDQAKPISFSRNAKGEVFVEGDFPPYALIAHVLIGETTLEMGKIIFPWPDEAGVITVTCHTGRVRYQTGQLTLKPLGHSLDGGNPRWDRGGNRITLPSYAWPAL
jgi:hypothetical protein